MLHRDMRARPEKTKNTAFQAIGRGKNATTITGKIACQEKQR